VGDVVVDGIEPHRAVAMRVAPGHQHGAAGLADGDGDVRLLEVDPFAGEAIDIGRDVGNFATGDAGRVVIHVVGGDEEDVERLRGGGELERAQGN
jgi:hypothetical protein